MVNGHRYPGFPVARKRGYSPAEGPEMIYDGFTIRVTKASFPGSSFSFFLNTHMGGHIRRDATGYELKTYN